MYSKIFKLALFIIVCHSLGCVAIYRSVKNQRDTSYKEGVVLFNQNKIPEAHKRFKKVHEIEPEYQRVKQYLARTTALLSQKQKAEKQRANFNFERGMFFFKKNNFEEALKLFVITQELDSSHLDVDDRIDDCRKKLAPKFDAAIKAGEAQFERKQYTAAYNTCLKAKLYDPSSMQLSSLRRKIEGKLEDASKKNRDAGKEHYKKKEYAAAQKQLQLAVQIYPWDKETKELLEKCTFKINLDKYYLNAMQLFNKNDLFGARAIFIQVNSVEPRYKATEQYLAKINENLAAQVGNFYSNGVAQYDKGNYEAAIAEFNKVLAITPGNSQAQEYRQRAESKLEIKKSLGSGENQ